MAESAAKTSKLRSGLGSLGVIAHVALGLLYGLAGLATPGVVIFLMWAAWGAALALLIRNRQDLRFAFGIPLLALGLWIVVVLGLGAAFNWRA
ncbi:MAG: hypothetical protein M3323_08570 [Actinomycetota bacterium]|nr:hypothetical protein [Actinomycetota bacterium]